MIVFIYSNPTFDSAVFLTRVNTTKSCKYQKTVLIPNTQDRHATIDFRPLFKKFSPGFPSVNKSESIPE